MHLTRLRPALIAVATLAALTAGHSPAAAQEPQAGTETQAGKETAQAAVTALVAKYRAMGASAFHTGTGDGWTVQAGKVSDKENRPIGRDDHSRIGSLTKTFVSTVVLQLVAEGKVDLDTGFGSYLPGLTTGTNHDDTKITVRHLLQHTSGIADYLPLIAGDPTFWWSRHDVRNHATTGLRKGSLFPPGSDWKYSNTNYILLGLLIEKVTGSSAADEISRRILQPHGLTDTGLQPAGQQQMPTPYVTGYLAVPIIPVRIDMHSQDPSAAWTAGAMYSSARDLAKFLDLLVSGQLLPPHLFEEMTTPPPLAGKTYGLGIVKTTLPCGKTIYFHDGTVPGYSSVAAATADEQVVVFAGGSYLDRAGLTELYKPVNAAFCD